MVKTYIKIDDTTFEENETKEITEKRRYTREQIDEQIASAEAKLAELKLIKSEADKLKW